MPQTILDSFTTEYGVKVNYQTYESQEEAVENLRAGQRYDVVILDYEFLPALIAEHLLAEINYQNVPNAKYLSPNFRDLVYDPGNDYSVLHQWGTTGLLIRRDEQAGSTMRWADLWDQRYANRVVLWPLRRYLIGITLLSLGYSPNSENPAELEAVLQKLIKLKQNSFFWDLNQPTTADPLGSGQAVLAYGWAYDALTAQTLRDDIRYVLPAEGTILWGDNMVIPANSPNKYTAELFINFLLKPEISAQIANELGYATPNEAALPLIDPELRDNPIIFPATTDIKKGHWVAPLSPSGEKLYAKIWEHFLAQTDLEKEITP
jgi:spermidine/putrescine transport system substrate-binding protein